MNMPVIEQFQALGVVVLLGVLAWAALIGTAWIMKRTWRLIVRL